MSNNKKLINKRKLQAKYSEFVNLIVLIPLFRLTSIFQVHTWSINPI